MIGSIYELATARGGPCMVRVLTVKWIAKDRSATRCPPNRYPADLLVGVAEGIGAAVGV